MDIDDRPAKPPDIKKLERIKQWHNAGLGLFNEMYEKAKANLAKRNYDVNNAAVLRKEWREFMQWQLRIHWSVAQEIEDGLHRSGKIEFFGSYARPVKENKA